jgi:hypothetical protein
MKKLILMLPLLILIGCGEKTIAEQEADLVIAKKQALLEVNKDQITAQKLIDNALVVNRDGCQYLTYKRRYIKGGISFATHKGDCNNSIHKQ